MSGSDPILRVLHVTPSFYPATYWGGPIFSTRAVCDGVASAHSIEVSVLTTDAAGPNVTDRLPNRYATFPAGYKATYTRRIAGRDIAPGLLVRLLPAVARADVVHLTGTYSFPTLPTLAVCRLVGRPVVWSPRGAIQARIEWAGAQRFSKVAFERAAHFLAPKRTTLHLTAEVEAELTAQAMPDMRVRVIPNSVEIPKHPSTFPRAAPGERPLRLMFLSRLHEKKGCDLLLQALAEIPDATLDVYGSGEAEYLAQLTRLAYELGVNERVTFRGHVDGVARESAYQSADLFVLPSRSENFGNAIAEALAFAVPVVTTTATPWAELERRGCGAWVPPRVEALRSAISYLAEADLAAMGRAGRDFMQENFAPEIIARTMADLYREVAVKC